MTRLCSHTTCWVWGQLYTIAQNHDSFFLALRTRLRGLVPLVLPLPTCIFLLIWLSKRLILFSIPCSCIRHFFKNLTYLKTKENTRIISSPSYRRPLVTMVTTRLCLYLPVSCLERPKAPENRCIDAKCGGIPRSAPGCAMQRSPGKKSRPRWLADYVD